MRFRLLLAALAAAACTAACAADEGATASSGEELAGFYRVVSHTYAPGCAAAEPVGDSSFFVLERRASLAGPIYSFGGCADATDATCENAARLINRFSEPTEDGWRGSLSLASPFEGECTLAFVEGIVRRSAGELHLDSWRWSATLSLPEAECTTGAAEERASAMDCEAHEQIVGQRELR